MLQRREGKRAVLPCMTGAAGYTGARSEVLAGLGDEVRCWRRVERENLCFLRREWCVKHGCLKAERFPPVNIGLSWDGLCVHACDSHCQLWMCGKSMRSRGRRDGCCACVTLLGDTSGRSIGGDERGCLSPAAVWPGLHPGMLCPCLQWWIFSAAGSWGGCASIAEELCKESVERLWGATGADGTGWAASITSNHKWNTQGHISSLCWPCLRFRGSLDGRWTPECLLEAWLILAVLALQAGIQVLLVAMEISCFLWMLPLLFGDSYISHMSKKDMWPHFWHVIAADDVESCNTCWYFGAKSLKNAFKSLKGDIFNT